MTAQTLQHCIPVAIWTTEGGPEVVAVSIDATGAPAEAGVVEVSGANGQVDPPLEVPTGTSKPLVLPGVTMVVLHYKKSAEGPNEIPVDWTLI